MEKLKLSVQVLNYLSRNTGEIYLLLIDKLKGGGVFIHMSAMLLSKVLIFEMRFAKLFIR